jgi:hypothetical protein
MEVVGFLSCCDLIRVEHKDRFGRYGRFGSLESAAGVERDF